MTKTLAEPTSRSVHSSATQPPALLPSAASSSSSLASHKEATGGGDEAHEVSSDHADEEECRGPACAQPNASGQAGLDRMTVPNTGAPASVHAPAEVGSPRWKAPTIASLLDNSDGSDSDDDGEGLMLGRGVTDKLAGLLDRGGGAAVTRNAPPSAAARRNAPPSASASGQPPSHPTPVSFMKPLGALKPLGGTATSTLGSASSIGSARLGGIAAGGGGLGGNKWK
jgi:hypothetical protein